MILDELANSARKRVEEQKKRFSLEEMKELAKTNDTNIPFAFEKALRKDGLAFICEVKKASPSKSIIAQDFPYLEIAQEYEQAGADCISVLTEPTKFLGRDEYLTEISKQVKVPLLRKDFTVDKYMIYQAKALGASAILLICALLDTDTLKHYIKICDRLGLSALVETHDETEIASAVKAGARIIGVNNRNLKDFTVDIQNCIRLKKYIPKDVISIGESGIQTYEDIVKIRDAGIDAVLIGETLMRAKNKKKGLERLKGVL
ncbi:indole-3-glycerol phosphate synthase TrpC [Anaerotignum propionicum]|uniref:indole-3-glycerol phosphate synthase TrpC n=1 Tax=Anaerotignum propionicum TaxID=28446 RepID=UPI00210BED46|nr:indole-3-glycerol phosphate synthase TrpC [Anaerotignum propionicum]MCQ4937006.1 indole-3-glycerol phosphate synthase TrpC [Anaerotignum propionicum]